MSVNLGSATIRREANARQCQDVSAASPTLLIPMIGNIDSARTVAPKSRVARDGPRGRKGSSVMNKNTICLWYDKDAEAAARFYAETFPDSSVGAVQRA